MAETKNLDLRTAAYVLAITRLNDYYTTRGLEIWFVLFYSFNCNEFIEKMKIIYSILFKN